MTFKLDDIHIAPSILSGNFACLQNELDMIKDAGEQIVHLDIMDGHFVPNITIGPVVIKSLRKYSDLYFDAHLMIDEPEKYYEQFIDSGVDNITFHIETKGNEDDVFDLISKIKNKGVNVGISLNPGTPVEKLFPFLSSIDLALVMSVWPGFGGQSFIPEVLPKAKAIYEKGLGNLAIEIDGGINEETIIQASENFANIFVAGSAVFRANDPKNMIKTLKEKARLNKGCVK